MDIEKNITEQIRASMLVKEAILADPRLIAVIGRAARTVTEAYEAGKKTLLAGNGGSAADAQHIAGEFVSRFRFDRPGLASVALTTDTSILTAIGNDYGYDELFARQIQAQGAEGDVFIGISTSGNSVNLVRALAVCREKGIRTIGLTGADGGVMAGLCDVPIRVPSSDTPRIQESHILIGHILCGIVEEAVFGDLKPVRY